MKAANDNSPARLMTQKQAAAYCGVSAPTFAKWVLVGSMPPALSATRRWDRRAIDVHLDKLSGLGEAAVPEDDYDRRKRERDARKAARGGVCY
ncbi:MAG: uncharacterized protein K0S56_507 [Microvirga sp.]|jgi:predicted DNA-binding transcriptional regulator AlpA|nr:uncharacterized protein [Microvirga sp.]